MKRLLSLSIIFSLFIGIQSSWAAITNAGDQVTIDNPLDEDLYLAGDIIRISAIIKGDILAAGSEVYISDSVYGDAILAGGEIYISGYNAISQCGPSVTKETLT